MVVANLNARIQPVDRGELYEDPLEEILTSEGLGEIAGSGTQLSKEGEVENCDIEIMIESLNQKTINRIVEILESLGAPKGSKLMFEEGENLSFGKTEGMAIYINVTDLPAKVYKECSFDYVCEELVRLIDGAGNIDSLWQGATENALYLYGLSFKEMHSKIEGFISTYPLCQKCRVVQIA